LPICCTVATTRGAHCSGYLVGAVRPGNFCATPTAIFQPSSRPCANTGCQPATPAPADYGPRGSSYRLRKTAIPPICRVDPSKWRAFVARKQAERAGRKRP
jgi:hypothetical protein